MAKFSGELGYQTMVEVKPGVFKEDITVRKYMGDVLEDRFSIGNSSERNGNLTLSNRFSIVADPYAMLNYANIRWVKYQGVKWGVTSVTPQYPRIIVTAGSVFTENSSEVN